MIKAIYNVVIYPFLQKSIFSLVYKAKYKNGSNYWICNFIKGSRLIKIVHYLHELKK